jgi:tetrahydromethanopterin S-methyltransferase subunit F
MPKALKASDTVVHHHKDRHLAEKFERLIGVLMVIAIAGLAVGLVYGVMITGTDTPSWMR